MKRFVLLTGLTVGMVLAVSASDDEKIDVCHKGQVINISVNAVQAHLAHGDTLYDCVVPCSSESYFC